MNLTSEDIEYLKTMFVSKDTCHERENEREREITALTVSTTRLEEQVNSICRTNKLILGGVASSLITALCNLILK